MTEFETEMLARMDLVIAEAEAFNANLVLLTAQLAENNTDLETAFTSSNVAQALVSLAKAHGMSLAI